MPDERTVNDITDDEAATVMANYMGAATERGTDLWKADLLMSPARHVLGILKAFALDDALAYSFDHRMKAYLSYGVHPIILPIVELTFSHPDIFLKLAALHLLWIEERRAYYREHGETMDQAENRRRRGVDRAEVLEHSHREEKHDEQM